jgi:gliding motility-associated-like protein
MAYNYPICLQAQSQHGCIAEECADLSIKENLIFFCPNAFTPNNDDRNERFIPIVSGHDPAFYKFQVYDRWGQKVFETHDHQEGWLGDHTGGDYHVQNDVYYYRVEVKERMSTETKVFQGHVTVLR